MRLLRATVTVIIGVGILACGRHTADHESQRIVFDDWWNVDYVKNGCDTAARGGDPCPLESTPEDVVREFESDDLA